MQHEKVVETQRRKYVTLLHRTKQTPPTPPFYGLCSKRLERILNAYVLHVFLILNHFQVVEKTVNILVWYLVLIVLHQYPYFLGSKKYVSHYIDIFLFHSLFTYSILLDLGAIKTVIRFQQIVCIYIMQLCSAGDSQIRQLNGH